MIERGREKYTNRREKRPLELNPEGVKNLGVLLDEVGEYFTSEMGIEVTDENRISEDWAANPETGCYSQEEVEQDKEKVRVYENTFAYQNANEHANHERNLEIAETFEKVVSVVFHYALRANDLAVISTTRHTDIFDGVDSFVLDLKTGEVICAIDETNSNENNIIEGKKLDNILKERDPIKHGIAFDSENQEWYPSQIERADAPLTYLSAPREKVVEFIDKLAKTDPIYIEDVEEVCDDFFVFLVDSLYQSLDHIMLNSPNKEQRGKIQGLIDTLKEKTGVDFVKRR